MDTLLNVADSPDQINVEQILEILNREIIDDSVGWMSSSIVDQTVQLTEFVDRFFDQIFDRLFTGHVTLDEVTNSVTWKDFQS